MKTKEKIQEHEGKKYKRAISVSPTGRIYFFKETRPRRTRIATKSQ